ncbi:MAG TPA: hypothetical protein VJQ52_18450, partial [Steroidobacteraceae bacterium]|nr:hypothetical protein [Steroidobacteraceae bacterium]
MVFGIGQGAAVLEFLRCRQCLLVERSNPTGESVDPRFEGRIGKRTVDPALALRSCGIEVRCACEDLHGSCSTGKQRQAFDRATVRDHYDTDLRLMPSSPIAFRTTCASVAFTLLSDTGIARSFRFELLPSRAHCHQLPYAI